MKGKNSKEANHITALRNNDSALGFEVHLWGGGREREREEVRQQKETGSVSLPTGILLQLLLEKDKAAPGARRGRRHSGIVFKLIRSERWNKGYMRSFATRSLVWIWLNSAFMSNPFSLDRKVWKRFQVISVAFLQNTYSVSLWGFHCTLVASLCAFCWPVMPTAPPEPANLCPSIPAGAV